MAVYWQSSDTETCVKKLSQILANNIDNVGRGIGLRIYVRYCRSVNTSLDGLNVKKVSVNIGKNWLISVKMLVETYQY